MKTSNSTNKTITVPLLENFYVSTGKAPEILPKRVPEMLEKTPEKAYTPMAQHEVKINNLDAWEIDRHI